MAKRVEVSSLLFCSSQQPRQAAAVCAAVPQPGSNRDMVGTRPVDGRRLPVGPVEVEGVLGQRPHRPVCLGRSRELEVTDGIRRLRSRRPGETVWQEVVRHIDLRRLVSIGWSACRRIGQRSLERSHKWEAGGCDSGASSVADAFQSRTFHRLFDFELQLVRLFVVMSGRAFAYIFASTRLVG